MSGTDNGVRSSLHASIRSTHCLGKTTNPLGNINFSQSTLTPPLAHSLAHLMSHSSGAGFSDEAGTNEADMPKKLDEMSIQIARLQQALEERQG